MHMESGKPSGEDFHVESNDDDDDEKAPKKDFNLLKSWVRHSKAEGNEPKEDKEDEEKTTGEELVSLFETEPVDTEEDQEVIEEEVEEAIPVSETEELENEEYIPDDEFVTPEAPDQAVLAQESEAEPEFVVDTLEETPEESIPEVIEDELTEVEEAPTQITPETDIADVAVETESTEPDEEPKLIEDEPTPTPPTPETDGDDGDEEEPPTDDNNGGSAGAGSPFAPGTDNLSIPAVPVSTSEALPTSPTINVNKGSNALPIIATGTALYAAHKAGKVGREARAQDKAQTEAMNDFKEAQGHQQAEFNRKLAEVRGAQELAAAAAAEQANKHAQIQSEKAPEKKETLPDKKSENREVAQEKTQETQPKQQGVEKKQDRLQTEVRAEQGTEKISKVDKLSSIGELIAEQQAARKVDQAPEAMTDIPESSNVTYLDSERILETNISDKSSELILNQSEAAAEQNVAQEKQYELRHEVKDVASSLPGGLGAATATSISTDDLFAKDVPAQELGHNRYLNKAELLKNHELHDKTSSAYKQAMWAGFWGAGILLIAMAIWALSS